MSYYLRKINFFMPFYCNLLQLKTQKLGISYDGFFLKVDRMLDWIELIDSLKMSKPTIFFLVEKIMLEKWFHRSLEVLIMGV